MTPESDIFYQRWTIHYQLDSNLNHLAKNVTAQKKTELCDKGAHLEISNLRFPIRLAEPRFVILCAPSRRLRLASARQPSFSASLRAKAGGAEEIRTPDL